jgi:modulator of FtsH protease HflK
VLTEYAKAPAVTRERIYIETMQQVLASTSKVMMDYRGGGNLLYLPLDRLMQSAGGQAAGEAAPAPRPAPAEPAAEAAPRSREALRNRERADR